VGTASSGESAVARIGELQPDVALVNTRMPGLDGLEVARRVAADRPATRVVLLAADPTEDVRRRARDCGADACVSKALPRRDILDIAARAGHAR
jgi:DNA-binding NarL/FixJ family response regulator